MLVHRPEDGEPELYDSAADIEVALDRLAQGTGRLAIDTERAGSFLSNERACLIQVRRAGAGTVLLDSLRQPAAVRAGAEIFNSAGWILHSASDDLPCLLELGLRPPHLDDTMVAGSLIGMQRPGLNPMLEHFLDVSLEKGKGKEDWSQRPLPADMLNYAALDVEYLDELLQVCLDKLDQLGRMDWYRQECDHAVAQAHPLHPMEFTDLKSLHKLRGIKQLALAYCLHDARLQLAEDYDIPLTTILPHASVIEVARAAKPLQTLGSELRRNRWRSAGVDLSPLFDATAEVLHSPPSRWKKLDLPGLVASRQARSPFFPAPSRWKEESPRSYRRYEEWRDILQGVAEDLGLRVETLVALRVIKGLAWQLDNGDAHLPAEEFLAAWGVRPWQISIIIDALDL